MKCFNVITNEIFIIFCVDIILKYKIVMNEKELKNLFEFISISHILTDFYLRFFYNIFSGMKKKNNSIRGLINAHFQERVLLFVIIQTEKIELRYCSDPH